MELPDEVVDLVHEALHATVHDEHLEPVEMARVLGLQDQALARLEDYHQRPQKPLGKPSSGE